MASERLPEHLRSLFWDYDFDQLVWPACQDLAIARILERGGDDALRWLRKTLGDENLRSWILTRQGRGLDPKRLRFWQLILDLPEQEVARWIEESLVEPWARRNG
jgi:hypothetical protein